MQSQSPFPYARAISGGPQQEQIVRGTDPSDHFNEPCSAICILSARCETRSSVISACFPPFPPSKILWYLCRADKMTGSRKLPS